VSARTIETAFGRRSVVRRFGAASEYAYTIPRASAPNGEFWVFNEQRGWVPVPSNGRAVSFYWKKALDAPR